MHMSVLLFWMIKISFINADSMNNTDTIPMVIDSDAVYIFVDQVCVGTSLLTKCVCGITSLLIRCVYIQVDKLLSPPFSIAPSLATAY